MARIRSPNYPALSLPEAIDAVAKIQSAEQCLAAPKELAAKHIGYRSYHGLAKRAIAAIENYGLLEEATGNKVKVSPLAMSILFPANPEEKQKAINDAAFRHPLFVAIKKEWHGSRPSEENLRVYLIRRKFATDAQDRVIAVYRQTMDLVTSDSGAYILAHPDPADKLAFLHPPGTAARFTLPPPPASGLMRVSFNGDLLEVSAVLADVEAVDRLMKALQANKALLPEKRSEKNETAN